MLGVIIDYISDGDYYKIKTEDGIYLAYQKKSKDIFPIKGRIYFKLFSLKGRMGGKKQVPS